MQTYAVLLYYVDYLRKQDKFSNFCIHLFIFTIFEYYDRYKQNRKKRLNSPASPLHVGKAKGLAPLPMCI